MNWSYEHVNVMNMLVLLDLIAIEGKLAAQKARDLGIGKDSDKLEFASLYGMADAMSYGLRNARFSLSKYLPFRPV
ncbi:Proline dehydrogenase [Cynara cardunculus var. scolymus]|uniref:Proline dehydrogenase n=1 Tax=Cynara cardunculus var. scolymus TaxID=59895 RepID=A0A118K729_CYNCS|nr:Proline dehydrogenase [Cynara cardunculus var. scolymus]